MGELWKGSTQSMGDVKELIPEFYYLDDMFVNGSCLPFGQRQNGEIVSDVVRFPAFFRRLVHRLVLPDFAVMGRGQCATFCPNYERRFGRWVIRYELCM